MATSLVDNLGGNRGFGGHFLARNDDEFTGFIDLRSIFGQQGINFFGREYTGFYLNNNGSVTFASGTGTFTPSSITGSTSNPIIAPFWADVDTRGLAVSPTPGGTSVGSNLLWYDIDIASKTFTATWDDVGYYNTQTNKLNAFQLSITQVSDDGDFDIVFRYENIDWTTGGASGGTNGLGGTPARAGYSSGNGVDFFELSQSGNQAGLLALESASNVGTPGTFIFNVRSGSAAPSLSIGDVSITEGNGPAPKYAIVPVFLAASSASTITVQYSTADNVAIAGSDYVAQAGTLTFAAGVTQQNLFIELIGDNAIETDESFVINLSGAVGAPIGDPIGEVTIVNDDGLTISDVSIVEGTGVANTSFTFTVSLLTAAASTVTVNYATEAGTAAAGTDFVAANGTLTFAAGELSKTVTVEVVADGASEADEIFNVRLSGATGAIIADDLGRGTILNDDGLSVDDLTLTEGTAAPTGTATVTIRLLTAATSAVSVDWATVPGSAISPDDFTASNGTVTFAIGETVKQVTIPIVRDSLIETTESFTVVLSNATGTAIIDGTGTVRLIDDDGFSVADASLNEGNAGTSTMTFTVTLGSAMATSTTVQYTTVDGSALAGSDYVAASGTLTFAAGEITKTVQVTVNGDLTPEADEAFTLVLSGPTGGAGIVDGTATGTIFNDDGLSIADNSVTEGNSGTVTVNVTVTLSAAAAVPITVNYATADGTATAGIDYVATNGTLSFAVGETSKTIAVLVNGDTQFEGNETFRVLLSSPSGTLLVDGSATVTIINDDVRPPPSFRIVDAALVEGTGGGTSLMRFQVALSEIAATASSVDYATSDGTATAGSDYTTTTGTLTIPAGSLFGFIEVPVVRDGILEFDETFTVTLSNPSVGTAIDDGSATGTILNDDVELAIAATSANKNEGQSGTTPFTFTVTRSGSSSNVAHSADWAVSGAAVTGADFAGGSLPSGTVSFAAGETTKVITVDVAGDTVVEADEAFTVTLSGASPGASITTATAGGTIRNDDTSLAIAATSANKAEGQSGTKPFTFTVTRSGLTTGATSATWTVSGAAVTAADFAGGVLPSGTVSFAAGETSKVVTVNVAGDTVVEANEAFTVTLSNPTGSATIGTASATGTIRNDDTSLAIAATSANKAEGQSGTKAFTFTVTRSGLTTGATSATWTVSGAAVTAADFAGGVLPSGSVSFAAGETSKVVTVNVAGDTVVEANEAFTVTLSNPTGSATIGTASATGTIRNDDTSLGIAATSSNQLEGQSGTKPFTFTVTRRGNTTGATSATWTVGGAAVTAADFAGGVLPSGTVSFAAGETSKVVTVNVAGDTVVEADEAFAVTLSNPTGGATIGTASAAGTIRNDDSSLAIAATSADKAEGQSGTKPFTFTVTRSGNTTGATSATWTVSGAAVTAADFVGGVLPSGTVSFAAGETSKVVTVNVAGDTVVEAKEAFTVTLSNPTGSATIGTASATGNIRNDDTSLAIAATSANKAEGQSETNPFTFTVTRRGLTTGATSATWTVGGAAVTAADFVGGVLPSGTVSFAAGETSRTVTVDVAGDTDVELNENFTVTLSGASGGATIGTASATGTIRNDDTSLAIAATSADTAEGQSGTKPFTFTVTRSGVTTGATGATWTVSGADVTAADFAGGVLPSGTVSFAAGETSRTVTVDVAGDTVVEANEAFTVTLSNPTGGAGIGTSSAAGTIRNDDTSLAIAATSANKAEGQSGTKPFTFTVTRSGNTDGDSGAVWTVSGAAVTGADFAGGVLPSGTVSFAAGETSKVITVNVAGDTLIEAAEKFTVTLSNASPGVVLTTSSAVGTIQNDDAPAAPSPAASPSATTAFMGSDGNDTFVFDQPLVAANLVTIVDFTPGKDVMQLSVGIFLGAGPAGTLDANAFFQGAAAHDASDRIVYDAANGKLSYDADGTGAQAAQHFATIGSGLAITENSFVLA